MFASVSELLRLIHSFHFVVSFMNLRSRNVYLHFGHGQRSAPKSSFENGNKVIVFPHDALLGTTRSVSLRPWPVSSAARRYAELMFGRLCGLRVFLCVGVFARLCVGVLVCWCVVV